MGKPRYLFVEKGRRSEYLERPNAHLYDTGGMRRTHLRGHANILKRLLVHTGAFNVGLLMRTLTGVGTPRGLQGRVVAVLTLVVTSLRKSLTSPRSGQAHSAYTSLATFPSRRCSGEPKRWESRLKIVIEGGTERSDHLSDDGDEGFSQGACPRPPPGSRFSNR